jgi:hypothetical protein
MALLTKIDSNVTGLRYAVEESFKVLPTTPAWIPLEPNSYADFGGELTTVARNPINPSRQRKKGVVTDLDASGGFNTDLTQSNLQDMFQGFAFADLRTKDEIAVATVDGTGNDYEPAAGGDGYVAGDLLFAKGFDDGANNGLKTVTGSPGAATVPVVETLVTAATQTGTISRVGKVMGTGELDVDVSGTWPRLVRASGTVDFTTLGLISGEFIFVGGDGAGEAFATAANNGLMRVRDVGADYIELDKTAATMANETGTGLTVHLYFGRVLKNESDGTLIKRRTYQLERTLGAPETTQPAQIQAEYLTGSVPSEMTINMPVADKITVDVSFASADNEQRDAATGVKSGDRPALVEADAFNTSSDFYRIKLATVTEGDAFPDPLFAFVTELTLTLNNNVSGNKALGVLGSFEVTAGTFAVSGSLTAYFATLEAVAAVRNNSDVTLDVSLVKANQGIVFDIPLIALGDGRLNVEQDQPITLPLTTDAATGAKVNPNQDHTLLLCFFDYLPDLADA